jgi:4,5-dihydroxyphthalate decarboxylase
VSVAAKPRLSIAIEHYDRFVPLLDGTARPDGFELDVLQVGQSHAGTHGGARHERMIRERAFDIAELSLSSYLMARARKLPFTAIPFFPRRLFSQSQMWINTERGIREPRDLIGKKVGLSTFQTTLSVLAKGDLQDEYDVPWRRIEWTATRDETVPFDPQAGVVIRKAPDGADLGRLLQDGAVDAVFNPVPPKAALEGAPNIRRLFADPKAEEARYFHKNGFYPIMHVIAMQDRVLERHPEAAREIYDLLVRVNAVTEKFYDDPNWSRLAWGRLDLEEERRMLGPDLWPAGVAKNRPNLERFIRYSHDQGLIPQPMTVESLFADAVLET